MRDQNKIRLALKFAARKHAGQFRKVTNLPYVIHPIEVGLHLQNLGMSHDTIVAGYLHDTLEDTKTTHQEIAEIFGEKIAFVVVEVTEPDKKKALTKAHHYSAEAVKVKTADLMCNVRDILDDYESIGEDVWQLFTLGRETMDHYKKMAQILLEKAEHMPVMRNQLERVLTMIDSVA